MTQLVSYFKPLCTRAGVRFPTTFSNFLAKMNYECSLQNKNSPDPAQWQGWSGPERVFIDFKKAFDPVSHSKLLEQLAAYGISDKLLSWLRNYLSDRKQRVEIEGEYSDFQNIISGIRKHSNTRSGICDS